MKMKRFTRTAATVAAAACMAAVGIGIAATPASAASGCIVEVTQVKAWNLQEPPQDEIYLRLGTQYTNTRPFAEFQLRPGSDFNDVVEFVALDSNLRIAVGESDLGGDESLGSFRVTCTGEAFNGSEHVDEFNSDYEVFFHVSVQ